MQTVGSSFKFRVRNMSDKRSKKKNRDRLVSEDEFRKREEDGDVFSDD